MADARYFRVACRQTAGKLPGLVCPEMVSCCLGQGGGIVLMGPRRLKAEDSAPRRILFYHGDVVRLADRGETTARSFR